jgi:hypothetical protein
MKSVVFTLLFSALAVHAEGELEPYRFTLYAAECTSATLLSRLQVRTGRRAELSYRGKAIQACWAFDVTRTWINVQYEDGERSLHKVSEFRLP